VYRKKDPLLSKIEGLGPAGIKKKGCRKEASVKKKTAGRKRGGKEKKKRGGEGGGRKKREKKKGGTKLNLRDRGIAGGRKQVVVSVPLTMRKGILPLQSEKQK